MFDRLLSVIAPHTCVGCNREGNVLCITCTHSLLSAGTYCYRCQSPSVANETCPACLTVSELSAVHAAARYNQPAVKHVLWRLKFDRAQAAADDIARALALYIPEGRYIVVPAPTAAIRARQRGYDQACLIAKASVKLSPERLTYCPALARLGSKRQLGNSRDQRTTQLEGAFRVKRSLKSGLPILLVDDVITTGATLQAAAKALTQAGAPRVEALVFARA